MFYDVLEARYLGKHEIYVRFEDGSTGKVDLSSRIKEDTVFWKLRDIEYLKDFRVEYGTLVWGSGEVDIAPEALYTEATGKPVVYPAPQRARP